MRRVIAAAAVGLAVLASGPSASAQSAQTFSSPQRAVAGGPMFVRSVTPCPATGGSVHVAILGQIDDALIDETYADVEPDGSWVLTVAAPSDMAHGVTKSYSIRPTCSDGAVEYGTRRLYVTGLGGDAVAEAPDPAALTVAAAPASVETLDALDSSPRAAIEKRDARTAHVVEPPLADADAEPATTWVSDEAERAAEARAELARTTTPGPEREVALAASPVVASSDRSGPDGGIPWWSFVAAAVLAVGAVVGYGQRRHVSTS